MHALPEWLTPSRKWWGPRLEGEDKGFEVASGDLQRSYQEAAIVLPPALAAGYYRLTPSQSITETA